MPDHEMSTRTMLLVGGGSGLGVAAVLGVSLLFGGGGSSAVQSADSQPTAAVVTPAGSLTPQVPRMYRVTTVTATARLAERGLTLAGVIRVPSMLRPGEVVRTYPPAGTALPPGGRVTLYVSSG
jgi:PASTA domain